MEEDLRRRDPVKRAIYLGIFLVVISLVWFSSIWVTGMITKNTLSQLQNEINSRTNAFSQVQIDLKKIAESQNRIDALQKLSNARFLQGTLMNALQQCYASSVQLTRVRIEQNYTIKGGSPPQTNSFIIFRHNILCWVCPDHGAVDDTQFVRMGHTFHSSGQ